MKKYLSTFLASCSERRADRNFLNELIFSDSQVQTEMDIPYFNSQLSAIEKLEEFVNTLKVKYAEDLVNLDVPGEKLKAMEHMERMNHVLSLSSERKERIAAYIKFTGCMTHL